MISQCLHAKVLNSQQPTADERRCSPGVEGLRIILVQLIGAGIDDPVLWQAILSPAQQTIGQQILHHL